MSPCSRAAYDFPQFKGIIVLQNRFPCNTSQHRGSHPAHLPSPCAPASDLLLRSQPDSIERKGIAYIRVKTKMYMLDEAVVSVVEQWASQRGRRGFEALTATVLVQRLSFFHFHFKKVNLACCHAPGDAPGAPFLFT